MCVNTPINTPIIHFIPNILPISPPIPINQISDDKKLAKSDKEDTNDKFFADATTLFIYREALHFGVSNVCGCNFIIDNLYTALGHFIAKRRGLQINFSKSLRLTSLFLV